MDTQLRQINRLNGLMRRAQLLGTSAEKDIVPISKMITMVRQGRSAGVEAFIKNLHDRFWAMEEEKKKQDAIDSRVNAFRKEVEAREKAIAREEQKAWERANNKLKANACTGKALSIEEEARGGRHNGEIVRPAPGPWHQARKAEASKKGGR